MCCLIMRIQASLFHFWIMMAIAKRNNPINPINPNNPDDPDSLQHSSEDRLTMIIMLYIY